MIFEAMTGAANPLNGGPPVKTWGTIRVSADPLPPISGVARHDDRPPLQPFRN